MADAFLMRRDRALRGKALLLLRYAEGATAVSCAKGQKKFTVPSAALPRGGYAFALNEGGEWTLSMENENEIRTKTITVEAGKSYSVEMNFNNYLQKSGEGLLTEFDTTASRLTLTQDYILYQGGSEEGYSAAVCCTKTPVDLSAADTLYLDVLPERVGTRFLFGANFNKILAGTNTLNAGVLAETGAARVTLAVDVSGLTGVYYIGFVAQGANSKVYVYNIYYS